MVGTRVCIGSDKTLNQQKMFIPFTRSKKCI